MCIYKVKKQKKKFLKGGARLHRTSQNRRLFYKCVYAHIWDLNYEQKLILKKIDFRVQNLLNKHNIMLTTTFFICT